MADTSAASASATSVWNFITRFAESVLAGGVEAIIGTAIGFVAATGFGWLLAKVYNHFKIVSDLTQKREDDLAQLATDHEQELEKQRDEIAGLQSQIVSATNAVDGDGLWLARPVSFPESYERLRSSIPILSTGNLKGGVGKTTLTANLAAYFASKGKRVLAIDLDFQGSLSSLRTNGDIVPTGGVSGASLLVRRQLPIETLLALLGPVQGAENARILPSYYDLARTENAVMVHWLLRQEVRDVRYFIAEVLLSDAIQNNFDVVVIDSPPRLTTASIQALCSSTHLLIPTILDNLSVIAVQGFLDQISVNRQIWPHLKIAGVIGTMTNADIGRLSSSEIEARSKFKGAEPDALSTLEASVEYFRDHTDWALPRSIILPYRTFIPRKFDIGRAAGEGLAFVNGGPEIKALFSRLGEEVAQRIGLQIEQRQNR